MNKNKLRKKRIVCAVLSTALLTNSFHVSAVANAAASYKDGTYTGTASGFLGDITVSVTVTDGSIAAIDVTEQKDTPSYWERAETVIPEIIAANGVGGIDAVSGATYSSEGIINTVNNALARSNAPDCFEDGSGSADDPFVIKTAAQLAGFAESVDSGENYLGKYIVLDADIDLSDIENWNPIGAEGAASKNLDKIFAGDFNGKGHIIRGMNIKTNDETAYTDEKNVGLFSTLLSTAKVSNIRLENSDINVAGAKVVIAGGITGDITSKAVSKTEGHALIDSCSVSGSVSAKTNEAMVMTGGVVGRMAGNATVSNCISEASIYSSSNTKIAYGAGSMNAEGTFAAEKVKEINSGGFADKLNENLYDISKILANENIAAEFKLWKLSDEGKLTLSDEVFINDVIDASIFESGKGTAEEPYMLKTADQLRAFASSLSEHIDYSGVFIELMSDIDISDKEWTPIGDSDYVFNVSFDGKGHTVSGMTLGSADTAKKLEEGKNYIGFFSVLGTNAVVKNVKLTDVLINASYNASAYAGGITAFMNSDGEAYKGAVIDSCTVDGSIKLTSDKGNNFVGGIAAYVYKGAVINFKTNVDAYCTVIKGSAFGETGGLAALVNRGLVANIYSLGNVYSSGNREDEGMAVISSLVAVNAGYLVNCYGAGQHETNDYSIYTGAVSGWITGIGHTYDCYYNGEASMKIGEKTVDPVAAVGTRVVRKYFLHS